MYKYVLLINKLLIIMVSDIFKFKQTKTLK